jgi:hypothetical protein
MIKNVSLTKENVIAAKLTVMALIKFAGFRISKNDVAKELVSDN